MIIDEEKNFFIEPSEIKRQVLTKTNKKHILINKGLKNDLIENMKIPLFVPFLLKMIYKKGKIPPFQEFFDEYCNNNVKDFEKWIIPLKIRLSRAYLSVIRELYVRCFLKSYGFNVKYNIEDDTNNDVDAWVEKNGKFIALAIYQDTDYSKYNRIHKIKKRLKNIKYYDFGYNLDNTNKNDCVYFPYENELCDLVEELKNGN